MKRVVLVGAGLSHLEVLRRLSRQPLQNAEVILVTEGPVAVYSGMFPGVVAGHYATEQMLVDVRALATGAGARLVLAKAVSITPEAGRLALSTGDELAFDIVSLNTGAGPRELDWPGESPPLALKPALGFLDRLAAWEAAGASGKVGVVGGGVAGIEMAFALATRWRARHPRPEIVLIERSGTTLKRVPQAARDAVRKHLQSAGIEVVEPDAVPALGLAINATGAAAPAWLTHTGLELDAKGYVAVTPTLQSVNHPSVFASGDVASVVGHPRAKAGVFAVRQGPILFQNIVRALAGQTLTRFVPQRDWLSLIATGAKYAIGSRNGVAVEGSWVWRFKDYNDQGFLQRYRTAPERG